MVALPPGFTLFPYTTLFRSCACSRVGPAAPAGAPRRRHTGPASVLIGPAAADRRMPSANAFGTHSARHFRFHGRGRSEEHTSELQSRRDLVCRLLLEKKKDT